MTEWVSQSVIDIFRISIISSNTIDVSGASNGSMEVMQVMQVMQVMKVMQEMQVMHVMQVMQAVKLVSESIGHWAFFSSDFKL